MTGRRERPITGQGGFGLIEVVVSAAILFIVTTGTLSLIDGSNDLQNRNKARSVAATLAEQDLERMRSTPVDTLGGSIASGRQGTTATATKTVANVPYTVVSKAQWVRESTGLAPSCTDADGVAEYLQLTSTVTNTRTRRAEPVTQTSLLAPELGSFGPNTGSMSVQVLDRTGRPQPNVAVTATGPRALSGTTNAAGCAVFNYIPSGAYTAQVVGSAVNVIGQNPASVEVVVSNNSFVSQDLLVGTPGSLSITLKSANAAGTIPSKAYGLTVANPKININGLSGSLAFTQATSDSSLTTVQPAAPATPTAPVERFAGLFPFVDGYTVWSGSCAANRPTTAGYTGGTTTSVVPFNAQAYGPIEIVQPVVNAEVTSVVSINGRPTVIEPRAIVAYPADEGCDAEQRYVFEGNASGTGAATNVYKRSMGMPWGKYTACVQIRYNGTDYRQTGYAMTNTQASGTRFQASIVAANLTQGTCP